MSIEVVKPDPEKAEGEKEKEQVENALDKHSRDATDDLTLDEMRDRDIDNLTLLTQSMACKDYKFDTPVEATAFMGQAMNKALMKLGVNALDLHKTKGSQTARRFTEKRLNRQLAEKNVRIEVRETDAYPDPKDKWRAGIYIYHNNEIAYWVSAVIWAQTNRQNNIIMLRPMTTAYFIRTNVPMG